MNIYIGNLSYEVVDENLKELFEQYGEVTSARVIVDRVTGQSKGFGFVEMPNKQEALQAIQSVNDFEFMGRRLKVNESQPRPRDAGRNRGGRGGGGGGGFRR